MGDALGDVVELLGERLTWRPMSEIRPKPCWAIAARTSGASATRSTSFCALSQARISSQTRSATSLSIASLDRLLELLVVDRAASIAS